VMLYSSEPTGYRASAFRRSETTSKFSSVAALAVRQHVTRAFYIGQIWDLNETVFSEILTLASTKTAVLWVPVPYSLVEVYRRFRVTCCHSHQGALCWTEEIPLKRR
jgi:hypothetical protein